MLVAEPVFARGRAVGSEGQVVVAGPGALAARRRPPAVGPSQFGNRGHVAVVEHRLQHREQFVRRLSLQPERFFPFFAPANPNVTVSDSHSFTRQADQPFDEVRSRVGVTVAWELKNDHIPPSRVAKSVTELADQYSVAVVRRIVVQFRVGVAAHRARARGNAERSAVHKNSSAVRRHLAARTNPVRAAAMRTLDVFMAAHKSRGHRTGGYYERLGLERAEQKREHYGDDDRLDRLADGRGRRHMGVRRRRRRVLLFA